MQQRGDTGLILTFETWYILQKKALCQEKEVLDGSGDILRKGGGGGIPRVFRHELLT